MRIVFISRWLPKPINNGSKLRIYNLIRGLSEYHDVTLLSFVDGSEEDPNSQELLSLCSKIEVVPWRDYNPYSQKARLGFFNFKPRYLVGIYSREMEHLIKETLASANYDLVIASQLSMASYYKSFGDVPALFEEIELGLFHDEMIYANGFIKRFRLWLTWFKFKTYISHLLDSFSAYTVVSESERRLFVSSFPRHKEKVTVLPNCVNIADYSGQNGSVEAKQIIFTGPFRYRVNYAAMQWFIREVYPIILDQVPDACLMITGDHENLPLPSAPSIKLVGYVDDVKSLIGSSRVSIAPLLSGGGTRLKILEAMALGTPVVSTSKGAEGLGATKGEHLFVADSPELFAESVVKVIMDDELYENLSLRGKQFVQENYDWKAALPNFLKCVDQAVS